MTHQLLHFFSPSSAGKAERSERAHSTGASAPGDAIASTQAIPFDPPSHAKGEEKMHRGGDASGMTGPA